MKITLGDLENAFLFAGADNEFEAKAYLSSEMEDFGDLPNNLEDTDKYARVPGQHELDLGKALIFDFASLPRSSVVTQSWALQRPE